MFNVPPYVPKVYLERYDGKRFEFNSEIELSKYLHTHHDIRNITGNKFLNPTQLGYGTFLDSHRTQDTYGLLMYGSNRVDYRIVSQFSDILDAPLVYKLFVPKIQYHFLHRIPGSKRTNGHYYRRVKTTQERRWAVTADEFEPLIRPKRNRANLPDTYDDLQRSQTRSWKSHRGTQWKTNN